MILILSCGQVKKTGQDNKNKLAVSKFKLIDKKLNDVAEKLNTKVATGGSGYSINGVPVPQEKIETRRIVWVDGQIGKAIIIQPDFHTRDINSPTWNFLNLAWLEQGSSEESEKPFRTKYLLKKTEFKTIEKNIDQLLSTSTENLATIKRDDLK